MLIPRHNAKTSSRDYIFVRDLSGIHNICLACKTSFDRSHANINTFLSVVFQRRGSDRRKVLRSIFFFFHTVLISQIYRGGLRRRLLRLPLMRSVLVPRLFLACVSSVLVLSLFASPRVFSFGYSGFLPSLKTHISFVLFYFKFN